MWNLKFTCMTKLFHMYEKISHVIKCMEKKFTHMTKIFHMYYKISHACQKVHMHVKCWCGELVFLPTLISHGSFFSHTFHMIFTNARAPSLGPRLSLFSKVSYSDVMVWRSTGVPWIVSGYLWFWRETSAVLHQLCPSDSLRFVLQVFFLYILFSYFFRAVGIGLGGRGWG